MQAPEGSGPFVFHQGAASYQPFEEPPVFPPPAGDDDFRGELTQDPQRTENQGATTQWNDGLEGADPPSFSAREEES